MSKGRLFLVSMFLTVGVLMASGCTVALPNGLLGAQSSTDDYFPMYEGSKWISNILNNNQIIGTETLTLNMVSTSNGVTTASGRDETTVSGTTKVYNYKYQKSNGDVTITDENGVMGIFLKDNLKDGDSFMVNGSTFYVSHEDISVPAGTYKGALKYFNSSGNSSVTYWLARGVGRVRYLSVLNGNTVTEELTSYTK